ncbi:uncharacterized protein TNCV_1261101 [Trichonephila clavipes]|nr:uncharacterized protein TNCV_1261101 [Trichonephila clavipes]
MLLKEGGFVLGTFRSERMRVLYRSCQNDRLRVMLVLVHIDITPPHTDLPVFRRIGERTIPYSWRACKQLRHLVGCVIRAANVQTAVVTLGTDDLPSEVTAYLRQCLTVWLLLRWIDGTTTAAREGWMRFFARPGSPMKEGGFVLGTFRSERMREYFTNSAKTIVFA